MASPTLHADARNNKGELKRLEREIPMTRFGFRVFIAAYAAVMLAITVGVYTQEPSHGYYAELWWSLGAVSLSYLAMATGYWVSRKHELPSVALVFVFGLSASLLGVAALAGWPFDADGIVLLAFVGSAILIYLTVATASSSFSVSANCELWKIADMANPGFIANRCHDGAVKRVFESREFRRRDRMGCHFS